MKNQGIPNCLITLDDPEARKDAGAQLREPVEWMPKIEL
jgi:hypothetical protein